MKLRNNKGVTGVDISVTLVIVVLFVGLIATLVYNFSSTSQSVNRKADAINIAIQKVEEIKNTTYDELTSGTSTEYKDKNGQTVGNGPYKVETNITKHKESSYVESLSTEEVNKLADVIKIVKVTVSYTVQKSTQKVEISTVITKGD